MKPKSLLIASSAILGLSATPAFAYFDSANVEFLQPASNTTRACTGKPLCQLNESAMHGPDVGIILVGTYSQVRACAASSPYMGRVRHISYLQNEVGGYNNIILEISGFTGIPRSRL